MRVFCFLITLVQLSLGFVQAASAQNRVYAAWANEHYEAISHHSVAFEIALLDAKRQNNTDQAIEFLTSASTQALSREEYELLVTATPDSIVSPLMKRLLLGAYFLAPDASVRFVSLQFFLKFDAQMSRLLDSSLTSKERKSILKKASDDLHEFQKLLASNYYFTDAHARMRYLKSIARVIVADDQDVLSWTEKILKQKLPYPRFPYHWMKRLSQHPMIYGLNIWLGSLCATATGLMFSMPDPDMIKSFPIVLSVDGIALIAGIYLWHANTLKADWDEAKLQTEERDLIQAQRQAMFDFMQPDCDEVFTTMD